MLTKPKTCWNIKKQEKTLKNTKNIKHNKKHQKHEKNMNENITTTQKYEKYFTITQKNMKNTKHTGRGGRVGKPQLHWLLRLLPLKTVQFQTLTWPPPFTTLPKFFQFMETFLTSHKFEWSCPNLLKFHWDC